MTHPWVTPSSLHAMPICHDEVRTTSLSNLTKCVAPPHTHYDGDSFIDHHLGYSPFNDCRFEFYEGIVRASFGKFIASGVMSDASDATQAFLTEVGASFCIRVT